MELYGNKYVKIQMLEEGTEYIIKIVALNNYGVEIASSNELRITTKGNSANNSNTNNNNSNINDSNYNTARTITITNIRTTANSVTFTIGGNINASEYYIYTRTANSSMEKRKVVYQEGETTITGLETGVEYYLQVLTFDYPPVSSGEYKFVTGGNSDITWLPGGSNSNTNTSTNTSSTKTPGAVKNLKADINRISANAAYISWNAPNNAASNIEYKVYIKQSNLSSVILYGTYTTCSVTLTGLNAGTQYDVTVVACNIGNDGRKEGAAAMTQFTTKTSSSNTGSNSGNTATVTAPGQVKLVTASVVGKVLYVSWSSVAGAEGYEVTCKVPGEGPYAVMTTSTSITPKSVPYVKSGTGTVSIRAYKRNQNNQKIWGAIYTTEFEVQDTSTTNNSSNSSSKLTAPITEGAAMINATMTESSMIINWKPVTGANGYIVRVWVPGKGYKYQDEIETARTGIVNGLTANGEYRISVCAYKMVNGRKEEGPYSEEWKTTKQASSTTTGTTGGTTASTGGTTAGTNKGTSGTTAGTNKGTGGTTAGTNTNTATKPGVVQKLTVSEITSSSAKISWSKPANATGTIQYELYLKKSGESTYTPKGKSIYMNRTLSGLSAGTKYYIKVVAYNGTKQSNPTETSFTTHQKNQSQIK